MISWWKHYHQKYYVQVRPHWTYALHAVVRTNTQEEVLELAADSADGHVRRALHQRGKDLGSQESLLHRLWPGNYGRSTRFHAFIRNDFCESRQLKNLIFIPSVGNSFNFFNQCNHFLIPNILFPERVLAERSVLRAGPEAAARPEAREQGIHIRLGDSRRLRQRQGRSRRNGQSLYSLWGESKIFLVEIHFSFQRFSIAEIRICAYSHLFSMFLAIKFLLEKPLSDRGDAFANKGFQ